MTSLTSDSAVLFTVEDEFDPPPPVPSYIITPPT